MTKWKNMMQKKEEEITARDLINTDMNKISKLEFETIIRILAGLKKKLRRH